MFFVNGVFLNITEGPHINVSVMKELDSISVLSVNFFNHLLAYRATCEQQAGQSYGQWHLYNF